MRDNFFTAKRVSYLAAALFVLTGMRAAGAAEPVFLKAFYPLDEPRFHCVDIPGHKARVNVSRPLSVHTCKEGIWHKDELFDPAAIASGQLRMPEYGLCVGAEQAAPGAAVKLVSCDAGALNRWTHADYRLKLSAHPALCLTIGTDASRLTPGGKRLASRHMARSLALQTCDDAAFERQLWRFEKPQARNGPVMPFGQ